MTIAKGTSVYPKLPTGCYVELVHVYPGFTTRGLVFRSKYGTREEGRVPNRNQPLVLHYKYVEVSYFLKKKQRKFNASNHE